jgi:hypothetical protein
VLELDSWLWKEDAVMMVLWIFLIFDCMLLNLMRFLVRAVFFLTGLVALICSSTVVAKSGLIEGQVTVTSFETHTTTNRFRFPVKYIYASKPDTYYSVKKREVLVVLVSVGMEIIK